MEHRMHERMQEKMAMRLAYLKQQLKVSPAQEGAWTTWTTALKPSAQQPRPNRDEFARLSTPERIDRMRASRATRGAEMDKRADATKVFYGTLSAEQKKTFDDMSLRLLGGGHGGRGGHGHGGHGGFGGHGQRG
jgi:protein CpxP